MYIVLNFLLLTILPSIYGAKILGIFPYYGYSQFILGGKLMRELAARGHEVTVISPFPSKVTIKNYKSVSTAGFVNLRKDVDLFHMESFNMVQRILAVTRVGVLLTDYTLQSPEVQELLKSNATFDLVICEKFFNEAHMGFAYHYKTPLIIFSSVGPSAWANDLVRNPSPYSYLPSIFTPFSSDMNFIERLQNTFISLFYTVYKHFYIMPKQDAVLQKYFPGAPNLNELMYTADLVLLNSHVSFNVPAPTVTSMIEIGGFHIAPKPLPNDLQEFLDNAKNGAILFSMGSNLNSTNIPRDKLEALLKTFSKLKAKILWKWEKDSEKMPANIKTGKWLPQEDILGHPNIKAFISHCGLLSLTETVYHGVPVICVPIFGDQKMNSARATALGIGIPVRFTDITEDKMTWAINEILTNKSYSNTAKLRSKFMHDQPVKPLDKAMYWIEYVIRHGGAEHLRIPGLKLNWFQYYLLDIVVFILAIVFIAIRVIKYIFYKLFTNIPVRNKTKLS